MAYGLKACSCHPLIIKFEWLLMMTPVTFKLQYVIEYTLRLKFVDRSGVCGAPCWLEHWTHDHKVVGTSPDSSSLC